MTMRIGVACSVACAAGVAAAGAALWARARRGAPSVDLVEHHRARVAGDTDAETVRPRLTVASFGGPPDARDALAARARPLKNGWSCPPAAARFCDALRGELPETWDVTLTKFQAADSACVGAESRRDYALEARVRSIRAGVGVEADVSIEGDLDAKRIGGATCDDVRNAFDAKTERVFVSVLPQNLTREPPLSVDARTPVSVVAGNHVCSIAASGALWCTSPAYLPVPAPGATHVTSVVAPGPVFFVDSGALFRWQPDTKLPSAPEPVCALRDVAEVAEVGVLDFCVRSAAGGVGCASVPSSSSEGTLPPETCDALRRDLSVPRSVASFVSAGEGGALVRTNDGATKSLSLVSKGRALTTVQVERVVDVSRAAAGARYMGSVGFTRVADCFESASQRTCVDRTTGARFPLDVDPAIVDLRVLRDLGRACGRRGREIVCASLEEPLADHRRWTFEPAFRPLPVDLTGDDHVALGRSLAAVRAGSRVFLASREPGDPPNEQVSDWSEVLFR